MEIRIDTKKDSSEDIQKTIEFLQKLVESSGSRDFNTGDDVSSGMTGLFGDTPVMGAPPDTSDTSDSDDESKEEEEGSIEIIPY